MVGCVVIVLKGYLGKKTPKRMLNPNILIPTLPPKGTWITETPRRLSLPPTVTTNPARYGVSMSIPSPSSALTL